MVIARRARHCHARPSGAEAEILGPAHHRKSHNRHKPDQQCHRADRQPAGRQPSRNIASCASAASRRARPAAPRVAIEVGKCAAATNQFDSAP